MPDAVLESVDSLSAVSAADWDALTGGQPLLSHAFLHALEASACATPDTGWAPRHLLLRRQGRLDGAVPLYLKGHSYGEYVFDWAWADAWERAGGRYYPKLLGALPFTPVRGGRLLAATAADRSLLLQGALKMAQDLGLSSAHFLFPPDAEADEMAAAGLLLRQGVQFHWHNRGYRDYEDFLGSLNHDKRKKLRQERRKVREAGVTFERLVGRDITEAHWRFFHQCYVDTYRRHHSTPYLNLDFFLRIGETMPQHLLLALGLRDGQPLCAALDVFHGEALYGRYWGSREPLPGLHFEACYHQAIEFCIERGIGRFEGGAQGEHKLARGLVPVTTRSAHWLADPGFESAVRRFLARETEGVAAYVDELAEHAPFRRDGGGLA